MSEGSCLNYRTDITITCITPVMHIMHDSGRQSNYLDSSTYALCTYLSLLEAMITTPGKSTRIIY